MEIRTLSPRDGTYHRAAHPITVRTLPQQAPQTAAPPITRFWSQFFFNCNILSDLVSLHHLEVAILFKARNLHKILRIGGCSQTTASFLNPVISLQVHRISLNLLLLPSRLIFTTHTKPQVGQISTNLRNSPQIGFNWSSAANCRQFSPDYRSSRNLFPNCFQSRRNLLLISFAPLIPRTPAPQFSVILTNRSEFAKICVDATKYSDYSVD